MTERSRTRRFGRNCALAAAVVVGAAGAYAYDTSYHLTSRERPRNVDVAVSREAAVPNSDGAGSSPAPVTSPATQPAPATSGVLPFNAKLTSQDIPVAGGGVRSGGCSGGLIAPDWVVTAGHCFHDVEGNRVGGQPRYRMTVTIGKNRDSDPGGHTAEVTDVRQSPLNDLAVVKLSRPVTDVVPLSVDGGKARLGMRIEFAGWGSHSATVIAPSDHLKRGAFTVSKIDDYVLGAVPVVARTVENSPCPDDSGSPWFVTTDQVHATLYAVEDSGPDCPQPGTEVLARVDVVANWIRQQIAG